ncbi:hypothetical protein [Nocardia sp. MH4]|uniref:DUF7144 family membrane protein n=1 Tax=Nocardia sp. MH4 TaxID=1768677 RepID=UPI0027E24259|nr:hypothetical protein [Nocardia sp. MH4]
MTTTMVAAPPRPVTQGVAAGITMLAVALLLVASILEILRGIACLAGGEIFDTTRPYTFELDLSTWGWLHLLVGVCGVAIALGMILGARWALVVAAVLAGVSIIANFASLLYYPWWSVVVILLDLAVVWAVSTWEPERY